ncbi:MAG TPA: hypothetical protein DCF93_00725 [Desulfuromonas sp.]|nr:hypothetical protein [Desulfuromonas sp.]
MAIIEATPDMVATGDPNGHVLYYNRAGLRMLGFEPGLDLSTVRFFETHPQWAAKLVAETGIPHAIEHGTWSGETALLRRDGHEIPVSQVIIAHKAPDGSVEYLSTIARDITKRKEHEARLQREVAERRQAEGEVRALNEELENKVAERTAKLQSANHELESFSYSVSHDLRAPLRAIDGFSKILLEDHTSHLEAEGIRLCGVISDSARRMGRLIDDLLAFSRLGKTEINLTTVDMTALAAEVFAELTTPQERERIDFRLASLPEVKGDPALLRQVWANLLGNALKFSANKEEAIITVDATRQDEQNVYVVRDNGAGFDMRYANKLFGVFQRLHHEREFAGTGLGLAIVQRIVERHGGQVWAKSAMNRGATFFFTLG